MVNTSPAYKIAVTEGARATASRIFFGVYDITAKEDAVLSGSNSQPFTTLDALKSDIRDPAFKAGSFEKNYTKLDGSFCLMPDDISSIDAIGWWSQAMSDKDGVFNPNLSIIVTFDDAHSSTGLGVFFGTEDYCSEFDVTWYGATDNIIGYKLITDNKDKYAYVNEAIENYRKIIIKLNKTRNPFRYARLTELSFGLEEVFHNDKLTVGTIVEEVDPVCGVLSVNTLKVTVLNENQRFNMLNPEGIYAFLQRRQKIIAQSGIMIAGGGYEYVPLGTYYLSSWKNSTGLTATLEATDAIGLLDKTIYSSSQFWVNTPIDTVLRHVLDDAGAFSLTISPEIQSEVVNGYIPILSHREAIQAVLLACRCTLRIDRNGVLKVFRPDYLASVADIGNAVIIGSPDIEQKPLVTTVEATEYSYQLSATPETLFSSTFTLVGTEILIIPYSSAAANVLISVTGQGSLVGTPVYSAVAVRATVQGTGTVTIAVTGRKYLEHTRVVSAGLINLPVGELPQTANIGDNKLLTRNATAVAQHVLNYYQKRIKQVFNYWADPSLQAGDCIDVATMFLQSGKGVIERQEISFISTLKARVEITG